MTDLETVGLDGSQEGRQANLTLQEEVDISRAEHQPLSCQLHDPHGSIIRANSWTVD